MSGTVMLLLAHTRPEPATRRATPDMALPSLHAAVAAEIEAGLTRDHAAILAQPTASGDGWDWHARGTTFRRFVDLPPEGRHALLAVCGSILSDIRRLAESGRAPALQRAWPGLREVPSLAAVHAVDGRPVLVDWGHAPPTGMAGPLAGHDDGVAFVAPPTRSWTVPLAALASVALLGLAAGLLLPAVARWAVPEPAMCRALPGQLEALRAQNQAQARGADLTRLLASVNDDIGRKQLQCPLPAAPAPAPSRPPPRADLPQDSWDRHDLSMLEGCWHNITNMTTTDVGTGIVRTVPNWELCFDHSGHGRQSLHWSDGIACNGPEIASFDSDNHVVLTDGERCRTSGRFLYMGYFQCTRVSDAEATCIRTNTEGQNLGRTQFGRFVR